MKYDIFISYRRAGGKHFARTLKETLSKKGYSVFLDLDELKDGHFMESIYSAIDSSKAFFLVMSPDVFERCSDAEDHVRNEIQYALQRGMNIVPIVFDNHIPEFPENAPETIKSGIGSIQYSFLDTEHFFDESIDKLLKERVGHKAPKWNRKVSHWKWIVPSIIICIAFAAYLFVISSRTPEYYVNRADSLAGNEFGQKTVEQIKSELSTREWNRLVRFYLKGAYGHERAAVEEFDLYNQDRKASDLGDAQYDYHNAAHAFGSIGEYEKAIEDYTMAISCGLKAYSLTDDDGTLGRATYSMNNLAYCYQSIGDDNQALETIEKAIGMLPDDLNLYDSKGELLFLMGRYEESIAVWNHIVELDPYFNAEYWVDSCKVKLDHLRYL